MIISNRFSSTSSEALQRSSGEATQSRDPAAVALAACTGIVGVVAALLYFRAGLALSHYDAKAHLVVARRIMDSLTPGWEQIGAVWLPLPHLLNMVPVQIDALYRTGISGIAISVAAFVLAAYSAAILALELTGSRAAAAVAVGLLALNPNLLYLQSTPMTEPLLLGLTLYGVACLTRWARTDRPSQARLAGLALAGACLTRYEAWPITAAALVLAAAARWRAGERLVPAARSTTGIALYPATAVVLFLLLSRATVGEWLVTSGFYVPDNPARGRLGRVLVQLWWGTRQLSGDVLVLAGVGGVVGALVSAGLRRAEPRLLIPIAVVAAGALPTYAFFSGHPFRIRYMVPLVAAGALWSGIAVGLIPRFRPLIAAVVCGVTLWQSPPWDQNAAMLREAQWDRPFAVQRETVTRCIDRLDATEKILVSMGSLAHYMQDMSHAGFALRDFIHEGNGSFWSEALVNPARYAAWILVEERSEGGDVLFRRAQQRPDFLRDFDRTCEAAGIALYRKRSMVNGR